MLSIAAAMALTASHLDIVRGMPAQVIGHRTIRYRNVEDTTLDGSSADEVRGGDGILEGGPNKTILIRFSELEQLLPSEAKIESAAIYLTLSGGKKPSSVTIQRVAAPWSEGPIHTLNGLASPTSLKPEIPKWASNWKMRRTGPDGSSWQQSGANGPSDTLPLEGASLSIDEGDSIAIKGLGKFIGDCLEDPLDNHGLALKFDSACEFFSSEATGSRPRLSIDFSASARATGSDLAVTQIEVKPQGGDYSCVAHVKNVGDKKAYAFDARWITKEKPGGKFEVRSALDPGAEVTVETTLSQKGDSADHRRLQIALEIEPRGEDAERSNNALRIYPEGRAINVSIPKAAAASLGGDPILWTQEVIDRWNETYFAQSKFSFAPEGVLERVRLGKFLVEDSPSEGQFLLSSNSLTADSAIALLSAQLGLPRLTSIGSVTLAGAATRTSQDVFPGVMGGGDTRNDAPLFAQFLLPNEPILDSLLSTITFEDTGLFSATDVAAWNASIGKAKVEPIFDHVPKVALLRCLGLDGRPLASLDLDFFPITNETVAVAPAFSLKTNSKGSVPLKDQAFGTANAPTAYLVKATANGISEFTFLKAWQMVDAYSRGSKSAAFADLRFNLPSDPLDKDDQAKNRIVTDSAGSLPAKLAAAVDGSTQTVTALPVEAGGYVEIDLGRDRPIGEIRVLAGAQMWTSFDIMVYETGQLPTEAKLWAKETDWNWTRLCRSDLAGEIASVAYRATARRFRFIRLVHRNAGPGELAEIQASSILAPP